MNLIKKFILSGITITAATVNVANASSLRGAVGPLSNSTEPNDVRLGSGGRATQEIISRKSLFSPLPICGDSTFKPNENTYYTIELENKNSGLVWGRGPSILETDFVTDDLRNMALTTDKKAESSQWRFKELSPGEWMIISRRNGQSVGMIPVKFTAGDNHYATTTTLVPTGLSFDATEIRFKATCSSGKDERHVFFEAVDDPETFPHCDIDGCSEGTRIAMRKNGRITSKVTEYDNVGGPTLTCSRVFGPKFVESKRNGCGFFGVRRTCEGRSVPANQNLNQGWIIKEVTEFNPRGVPKDVQVSKLEGPGNTADLMSGIATAGEGAGKLILTTAAGAVCGPLCSGLTGVLFSFGLGFLNDAPPIEDRLNDLAKDIFDRTKNLLATGFARENAEKLRDFSDLIRKRFLNEYPVEKHENIPACLATIPTTCESEDPDTLAKINALEEAGNFLETDARDFEKILKVYLGSDLDLSENTFKQKVLAFDLFRLGVVEQLTQEQEAHLLSAFIDPSRECEEVVPVERLRGLSADYRKILEDTVEFLIDFRVDDQCCRVEYSKVFDNYEEPTEILSAETLKQSFNPQRLAVVDLYKEEMTHDIRLFSFPIQLQLDFLDTYVDKTLERCEKIKVDPDARLGFATDKPAVSEVSVEKTAFEFDEEISVDFTNKDTASGTDWVGIFRSEHIYGVGLEIEQGSAPRTCGDQTCNDAVETGTLVFGPDGSDIWPLSPGSYRAVLVGDGNKVKAFSKEFVVLRGAGHIVYDDAVVLAFSTAGDQTHNCGWYGCRVVRARSSTNSFFDVFHGGFGSTPPEELRMFIASPFSLRDIKKNKCIEYGDEVFLTRSGTGIDNCGNYGCRVLQSIGMYYGRPDTRHGRKPNNFFFHHGRNAESFTIRHPDNQALSEGCVQYGAPVHLYYDNKFPVTMYPDRIMAHDNWPHANAAEWRFQPHF